MTKKLPTAEARASHLRKMLRWNHYGYMGSCRWIEMKMRSLWACPTATVEAKQIAREMYELSGKLREALRTRIDV